MAATYTPIASITLGAAAASVTFSSIPQTYTDLVLVQTSTNTGSGGTAGVEIQFNGDTGTNYSCTEILGNGSSASSTRLSSSTFINAGASSSANQTNSIYHIMNYANATTNKTLLCRANDPGSFLRLVVGLWRNTSAVSSIRVYHPTNIFAAGATFNLYGILGANA